MNAVSILLYRLVFSARTAIVLCIVVILMSRRPLICRSPPLARTLCFMCLIPSLPVQPLYFPILIPHSLVVYSASAHPNNLPLATVSFVVAFAVPCTVIRHHHSPPHLLGAASYPVPPVAYIFPRNPIFLVL